MNVYKVHCQFSTQMISYTSYILFKLLKSAHKYNSCIGDSLKRINCIVNYKALFKSAVLFDKYL